MDGERNEFRLGVQHESSDETNFLDAISIRYVLSVRLHHTLRVDREENMAVVVCNGCFDVFHEGHEQFLKEAKLLGVCPFLVSAKDAQARNRLIVCVNSDSSARRLKAQKWGEKYPIDNVHQRLANVMQYADQAIEFDTEDDLRAIIARYSPCILVKGPDYANRRVTGDELAPVLILDTPEPESVKEMKKKLYRRGAAHNEQG